jgi:hypothetical protein
MDAMPVQLREAAVREAVKRLAEHGVKLDTAKTEDDALTLVCMVYGVEPVGHPRLLADEVLYRHKQAATRETNGRLIV